MSKPTVTALGLFFVVLVAPPCLFSQQVNVTTSSSTEALLVAIDEGSSRVSSTKIRAYGRLLDSVAEKCPENRKMVSDIAVKATRILEDEGVDASVWMMLNAIDEALKGEAASLDLECTEVTAALIAMMVSGE